MGTEKHSTINEVIAAWIAARSRIRLAALELPPDKQDMKFLGSWGVKDLLAHLIGWDYTYLQAFQDVREGCLPEFFAQFNPDWRKYNAALVEKYRLDDFAHLIEALDLSHHTLVTYLYNLPDQEFDFDFGVRARKSIVTIAWLLRAETHDEEKHAGQIEKLLKA